MSKATVYRFEIAVSFAGAHRDKARAIAELLSASIDPGLTDRSKGRVFFDEWFEHEILGDDMDVLLQRFYHEQSRLVVADLSDEYAGRRWCRAEARAIRALRFDLDPARDEAGRLRLLNVKLGDGEVPGVFKTTAYLDGVGKTAPQCARLILKRHALLVERMNGATIRLVLPAITSRAMIPSEGPQLMAGFRVENGEPCPLSDVKRPSYWIDLWVEGVPPTTTIVKFEILDEEFKDRSWPVKRTKKPVVREFLTRKMNSYGDVEIYARGIGPGDGNWFIKSWLHDAMVRHYGGKPKNPKLRAPLKQIHDE